MEIHDQTIILTIDFKKINKFNSALKSALIKLTCQILVTVCPIVLNDCLIVNQLWLIFGHECYLIGQQFLILIF